MQLQQTYTLSKHEQALIKKDMPFEGKCKQEIVLFARIQ
jgi:hypothetical protein